MLSTTSDLIVQFLNSRSSELREQMVVQHITLVHYVLGRLGISKEIGQDYEDMVSQGLMGLIDAVDRFDPSHGAQFTSYAILRIKGKILDHLRSMDWLSRGSRKRSRMVQNAISELWETLHREPTDTEIANHLTMSVEDVQQALVDSTRVMVSIDTLLNNDEEEAGSFHELLADEKQENPSDLLSDKELKQKLISALQELSEREQLVLSLYYYENLTFKEIGEVLRVSESRICQLHSRAICNLKALMKEDDMKDGNKAKSITALKISATTHRQIQERVAGQL